MKIGGKWRKVFAVEVFSMGDEGPPIAFLYYDPPSPGRIGWFRWAGQGSREVQGVRLAGASAPRKRKK